MRVDQARNIDGQRRSPVEGLLRVKSCNSLNKRISAARYTCRSCFDAEAEGIFSRPDSPISRSHSVRGDEVTVSYHRHQPGGGAIENACPSDPIVPTVQCGFYQKPSVRPSASIPKNTDYLNRQCDRSHWGS